MSQIATHFFLPLKQTWWDSWAVLLCIGWFSYRNSWFGSVSPHPLIISSLPKRWVFSRVYKLLFVKIPASVSSLVGKFIQKMSSQDYEHSWTPPSTCHFSICITTVVCLCRKHTLGSPLLVVNTASFRNFTLARLLNPDTNIFFLKMNFQDRPLV